MGVLIAAIAVAIVALVAIAAVQALIIIVPPNRAAVITGRKRTNEAGEKVGYRTVIGGRTLRIPIIETVAYLPLDTMALQVRVDNAFSKGGIPLEVEAVANVKIASTPENVFNNAVERLLGKPEDEIRGVAIETLMGNLRGVLATLTPEEVNEDRLTFAQRLAEEAENDMEQLGFRLDTLKIQNVSDRVGYLEAIGREKTAEIKKVAEVAEAERQAETRERSAEAEQRAATIEADTRAEVREREAEARQRSEVAEAEANLQIAEANNRLRVRQAELDREAESAEKVAHVSANKAEVQAQQELEHERVELERRRLRAEVIEPAEAEKQAAQARAEAEAAPIRERGKANAEVLKMLYAEMKEGGETAFAAFVMEKMPVLFKEAIGAVEGIDIERLTVMDSDGKGVGRAANAKLNGAMALLENVGESFGVNFSQVLRGMAEKAGGEEAVTTTRDETKTVKAESK